MLHTESSVVVHLFDYSIEEMEDVKNDSYHEDNYEYWQYV